MACRSLTVAALLRPVAARFAPVCTLEPASSYLGPPKRRHAAALQKWASIFIPFGSVSQPVTLTRTVSPRGYQNAGKSDIFICQKPEGAHADRPAGQLG